MSQLTASQKRVLFFICSYMDKNGFSPSMREICSGAGLSSPSTVFFHLKKLEELGYISWQSKSARTILVLNNPFDEIKTHLDTLIELSKQAKASEESLSLLCTMLSSFQAMEPMTAEEWEVYLKEQSQEKEAVIHDQNRISGASEGA